MTQEEFEALRARARSATSERDVAWQEWLAWVNKSAPACAPQQAAAWNTAVTCGQSATMQAAQNTAQNFNPLLLPEHRAAQIARDYGEQCADTDGLAAEHAEILRRLKASREKPEPDPEVGGERSGDMPRYFPGWLVDTLHARIARLTDRAERAEANLATAIRERDALRVELDQRMALPARALRWSV